MKRIGRMAGVVLGCCLATPGAEAFSVSYDQKVTKSREVFAAKVAIKDNLFRMETAAEDQTSVTIRNPNGIYTYLPKEGMAMKLPALNQAQQPLEHADNYPAYLQERHAERIGSETINGHPCEVYQFTDPALKGTTTAWVWKEKEFPSKMEIDGPDGTMVVELTNIQLGAAIQDSMFQLPPDVQVMDVGSMMNMR